MSKAIHGTGELRDLQLDLADKVLSAVSDLYSVVTVDINATRRNQRLVTAKRIKNQLDEAIEKLKEIQGVMSRAQEDHSKQSNVISGGHRRLKDGSVKTRSGLIRKKKVA